jgi:Asp-tRNA(Asn)/Glu-tRNA(Gln) amidotransferase A subunit family amidase
MTNVDPNALSAVEAARKIRNGELSSEQLVTACLNQIAKTDDHLKAWAYLDREGALAQAKKCDNHRFRGKPLGPLHGVPVGLKDVIDTSDMPTCRGSVIFQGRQTDQDARIVELLREAGAVILGKTKTTEFAFMHPTDSVNPYNADHTPGGSSTGSAVAVSACHVPLAVGTQTNGSVIRPASYCGVYGFKPSRGLIPRTGILQTSKTLDQVGVFARHAEDVALIADVISGYDQRDNLSFSHARPKVQEGWNTQAPVKPNLIWIDLPYHDRLSEDAKAGYSEVLQALGGQVERVQGSKNLHDLIHVQRVIHEYEIVHHLDDIFSSSWDHVSQTIKPVITRAREITEQEYHDALAIQQSAVEYFDVFFKDYDAVLAPSALGEAPLVSMGGTGDPICSTVWTTAGLPCLSLPLLMGNNDLPIGVQLIGAAEQDDRLLRTAHWMLKTLEIEDS